MQTNHRRAVRRTPHELVNDPELMQRYQAWVNSSETKLFTQMVNDLHVGAVVSPANPLAAQDALCKIKYQEGAISAVTTLLNLDDPDISESKETEEPKATWGTDK